MVSEVCFESRSGVRVDSRRFRIEIAESVIQLALCIVAKFVLRLASFFAALRGRSAFRSFVARLFAASLCGCGIHVLLCSVFSTPAQAWQVKDRQPEISHELPYLVGS